MKPSSKNEVMNGIVNAYIAQKALDKANNTHYADTWKILNGADDEIDASLKFDLSEGEWADIKAYLKANNIAFTLCLISYKDGHSQNSFVWYDDVNIYAVEMNEIGSVTFHIGEMLKPTDETSSSVLKMLLTLENGGANGGGGETTTKQVFKGGVDILDKPLDVESKATFGADVEVDGKLTINSAKDLLTKDGTSIGGDEGLSKPWFSSNEYIGILSKSATTSLIEDYISGLYNIDGTVALIAQNNTFGVTASFMPSLNADYPIFMYQGDDVQSVVQLPEEFFNTSTIINLGDINKKQATLYRHTVTFDESGLGYNNRFTAYSEKSTPIDSIQNLIAVFGNTKLQCSGTTNRGSEPCIGIDVGTNADTTFFISLTGVKQKISSWYSTSPESTLTITDSVTAM